MAEDDHDDPPAAEDPHRGRQERQDAEDGHGHADPALRARGVRQEMTRTITVKARDEHGAKVGDTVRLMETRPLAKTVNWRVTEIVKRAK